MHVPKNLIDGDEKRPSKASKAVNGTEKPKYNYATSLPTHSVPRFVPINKDDHRLDAPLAMPSKGDWDLYNERFHAQKPCNSFHLQNTCTTFNCPFDHKDLEPGARRALEYAVKRTPCPSKGACREANCFYGHLCQKEGCAPGFHNPCKFKADMHFVDPQMSSMVPVEEEVLNHEDIGNSLSEEWGRPAAMDRDDKWY